MATQELAIILKAKDEASKIIGDVTKNAQVNFDAVRKAIGGAMTVAGTAITGFAALSIKAFGESQKEMAKVNAMLATIPDVAKRDLGKTQDEIIKTAASMQKLAGVSDELAAVSITNLYQRTNDLTKAQELARLALDLSIYKQVDLGTATDIVSKVYAGNIGILGRYGIVLEENATKEEAIAKMMALTRGQAEAYGKTFEGQMKILKETFGDLQETIGAQLMPILQDLLTKHIIPIVDKIIDWMNKNPELTNQIVKWGAAIGVLMVTLGPLLLILPTLIASVKILIGVIGFLATGPVALIIAGIAALTVGIVLLIKHHDWLWEKIEEIWTKIKNFVSPIIDDMMKNLDDLAAPIIRIINLFDKFLGLVGKVAATAGKYVGGLTFPLGALGLQAGGIVTRPTLAMVGEAGPEAVIPLNQGGFGAINNYITISGNTISSELDIRDLARKVGDEITKRIKFNLRV